MNNEGLFFVIYGFFDFNLEQNKLTTILYSYFFNSIMITCWSAVLILGYLILCYMRCLYGYV